MSHFFSVLGNIVVFLLCLSVVVCLHEAGHLLVAKCFNVYCFEYSIIASTSGRKRQRVHRIKKNKALIRTSGVRPSSASEHFL